MNENNDDGLTQEEKDLADALGKFFPSGLGRKEVLRRAEVVAKAVKRYSDTDTTVHTVQ